MIRDGKIGQKNSFIDYIEIILNLTCASHQIKIWVYNQLF